MQALKLEDVLRKYASLDMFEGYPITSPTSPGPDGDTPFHMAAYDGDLEAVRTMIPHVPDVNMQGDIGNTPLHYAVSNRQLAMVEELLAYGADPAKGNDYGDTPLEYMASEPMFTQLLNRLKSA
jgi:hypothetical protein